MTYSRQEASIVFQTKRLLVFVRIHVETLTYIPAIAIDDCKKKRKAKSAIYAKHNKRKTRHPLYDLTHMTMYKS